MSDGVVVVRGEPLPELVPLATAFGREQIDAHMVRDTDEALAGVSQGMASVVVCDAGGVAGFDRVRELANADVRRHFALLVITEEGDSISRIVALELGADDVVSRPFSPREVALRTRVLLRSRGHAGVMEVAVSEADIGMVRLATERARSLALSAMQRRLLATLAARPGAWVRRRVLVTVLWGGTEAEGRALDAVIKRLRRRLEGTGLRVLTRRGDGFKLVFDEP